ncbi:MAG: tetratricopeptide repeat protein [Pirellulaceae bacterium]
MIRQFVRLLLALVMVWWFAGSPLQGQDEPAETQEEKKQAEDLTGDVGESSPEALVEYSEAADFQNNAAFDIAAEAWTKFLDKFSDDPKAVEARYNLGVCQLQLKQYEDASKNLALVVDSGQEFARREDAFLNLGWAHYNQAAGNPAQYEKASVAFQKLLDEFPEGGYRDQALFFLGESLYVQGKRPEAAKYYEELLSKHEKSEFRSNAIYALGATYEELGRFADAGKLYDEFLEAHADNPLSSEVRLRRAETLLQTGDFASAEENFAKLASDKEYPMADHALYRQAYAVARQEKYAAAGTLFAQLLDRFPDSKYVTEAAMAAARSFYRAEDGAAAEKWFRTVIDAKSPETPEAAHWLVRLWLKQGKVDQAQALLDRIVASSQDHPFYVNLLLDQADALYESDETKSDAVQKYVQIYKQLPEHPLAPQALYNAAFCALEMKSPKNSLAYANEFISKFPDHQLIADVKQVAGESELQLGNSASAAEIFDDVASTQKSAGNESSPVLIRQAWALYMEKKFEQVAQQLQPKIESFENADQSAEAAYLVGMSYFGAGDEDQAQKFLQQSLTLSKTWTQADEAQLNLSRVLRKKQKVNEAIAVVKQMLKDYPKSASRDQGLFRLAEYEYALEQYAASNEHYSAVLQGFPESKLVPYCLYGRGWSLLRSQKFGDAAASFTSLIEKFPKHRLADQALYSRAMSRQQAGDFESALEDTQAYLSVEGRTDQEKADALYVKGLSELGLKQTDQAITTLTSVQKMLPEYGSGDKVLYELAWALKGKKREQEALNTFVELAAKFPQSDLAAEAFYHLGEAAYETKDYAKAVVAYGRAKDRIGNNLELGEKIFYKMGWAGFQTEDYQTARDAFTQQATRYPDRSLANDAQFMIGECYFKEAKYEESLASYSKVKGKTVSSEQIAVLTLLHGGQAASQLKKWQDCVAWMTSIRNAYPNSPYLPLADYEQAWALQNLGQVQEAMQLYGKTADATRGEIGARARFMMGEVYFAQKDYANAIREFQKVMYGYGADRADEAVKKWQAKSGFEAGQCAGVIASQQSNNAERAKYVDAAKKFFEYVRTRHPEAPEATAAAEQLKKYGA